MFYYTPHQSRSQKSCLSFEDDSVTFLKATLSYRSFLNRISMSCNPREQCMFAVRNSKSLNAIHCLMCKSFRLGLIYLLRHRTSDEFVQNVCTAVRNFKLDYLVENIIVGPYIITCRPFWSYYHIGRPYDLLYPSLVDIL